MTTKGSKKANTGVIYVPSGGVEPRDFLTWHDFKTYRIWIHSRFVEGSYKQLAIEMQWIGKECPTVSPLEITHRLELASIRTSSVTSTGVGPGAFRSIAIGQILETHALLVSKQRRKQEAESKKKVQLVKKYELETFEMELAEAPKHATFADVARRESKLKQTPSRPVNSELRANAKDSVFIAYVYAEQVKAGSRQAALRTANLLGVEVSLVYVAVRTARKKGWLTSTGTNGQAVGELTSEGEKEFKKVNGPSMYEEHVTKYLGGK